jgi:NAD(P)-dependent dehydrogenase (short-subunit alcohol dehydrogenase family)
MAEKWTAADIPDQSGRLALVTGANSGLGLATARELARAGAGVILACRDPEKGVAAVEEIRSELPDARVELVGLNLADLSSVHTVGEQFAAAGAPLDLLINNAGVMAPAYSKTVDGFELQFGTNHLGHFALTGLLMDSLLKAPEPRVVTVSSTAHRMGQINFEDLQSEQGYKRWSAYGQSKLANLLFAFELDRRARQASRSLRSYATHPGYSATNLQFAGPSAFVERLTMRFTNVLVAQSADKGALPTLYAATEPDLEGGSFIGPDGWQEARGHPTIVKARPSAYDTEAAARLWEVSEELTGVRFDLHARSAV